MKFGQLLEYNMTNLFLEKSYKKSGGETILKNISRWIALKFSAVCFYCMPSWRLPTYIETKLQTACFYLKSFLKKQKEVRN